MTSTPDYGRPLCNFVGGQRLASTAAETTPIVDPSTGQAYASAPVSNLEDLTAAFAAARQGFEIWRDVTPADRSLALLRVADALESRAEDFVLAEVRNTGKPLKSMWRDEIAHIIDCIRFAAGAARVLPGSAACEYLTGHTSFVRREPLGVVAQITPWNYPLMMSVWKWPSAVAAGNAVVLKPAETTPVTPLMMAELAAEFLPPGVLNVVCGDRDTGRAIVAHPTPAMVAITGSVRAGREVAEAAGRLGKRTHLELGGKAPVLVFDDVDLGLAVRGIIGAGYFNAGQSCTAATRVLAASGVHDDFVAALAAAADKTPVGPDGYYGALNNPDQLARVSGFVDRRPAHAEVVAGGGALDRPGYYYSPTVIAGVRQGDELARDEIFGPVITVQRVTDEDQAVAFANDTDYGLAASVWTTNHARAMRMARRLDAGAVWLNCHSKIATEMPHGGFKASGYGSDLSAYALLDYTRIKHVVSRL